AEPATAPAAVSEITVEATHESATVKWKAPHDGGSAITGYTVNLSLGDTALDSVSTESELSATFEELEAGTEYTVTVVARNAVGGSVAAEKVFRTITAPATAPAKIWFVWTSATHENAVVNWAAPNDGGSPITGYTVQVWHGGTPFHTIDIVTETTVTVDGLAPADEYGVLVTAHNAVGSTVSKAGRIMTMPAPPEEPKPTPTPVPSEEPTEEPTPTPEPSEEPTPTPEPSEEPTEEPTPSDKPTEEPTPLDKPTEEPTPTSEPSAEPTEEPTPTPVPSAEPTEEPTEEPTPSDKPTEQPTEEPTPSDKPTEQPTPSDKPTEEPTTTVEPTEEPTPGEGESPIEPNEVDLVGEAGIGITVPGNAKAGDRIEIVVTGADEGQKVNVYAFSKPVLLGNETVGAGGIVSVALPAGLVGNHRIAVFLEDGSLVGWDRISIMASSTDPSVEESPDATSTEGPTEPTATEGSESSTESAAPTESTVDPAAPGDSEGSLASTGAAIIPLGAAAIALILGGFVLYRRKAYVGTHRG
ncbi:fibronectin type III domain-containing protein, partial [Paeniglutamicibacter sp. ORCA_105]|uniref:fibronectin type III domain-containing protein n=1 Tax=Paeniglutamicibacter sp. ORCA_105 TaxID=3377336 RepID=UPI003894D54D